MRRAALVVLVLGLVAALAGLALVWRALDHQDDLDDAGQAAEQAARAAAVEMTSYDYRTADEDFGWVDTAGTTKFRRHYAEVSAPIKVLVVKEQAHAEGRVIESAVRVRDTRHATVLLFVDQTLTSEASAHRELDQPRVVMRLVRQGSRWLVDDVELGSLAR